MPTVVEIYDHTVKPVVPVLGNEESAAILADDPAASFNPIRPALLAAAIGAVLGFAGYLVLAVRVASGA